MKIKNIKSVAAAVALAALSVLVSSATMAATLADNMLVDHTYNGAATSTWTVLQSISTSKRSSGTCDAMTCSASQSVFTAPTPEGGSKLAPMMGLPDWWPSYVRCTDGNDVDRLLILFRYDAGGVKYMNAGDTYIIFRLDGSYRTGEWIRSCKGKSVATLYNEGVAFR